jgi:preprotein translocase subunit SecG
MQELIFIVHILSAICLIALILVQHGKGADMGAAFGSGASQTVFGSIGSIPFLTKITALIAAIFCATSLGLGYFIAKQVKPESSLVAQQPATPAIPALPASAPTTTSATPAATTAAPGDVAAADSANAVVSKNAKDDSPSAAMTIAPAKKKAAAAQGQSRKATAKPKNPVVKSSDQDSRKDNRK